MVLFFLIPIRMSRFNIGFENHSMFGLRLDLSKRIRLSNSFVYIALFFISTDSFGILALCDGKSHTIDYQAIEQVYVYNNPSGFQTTLNLLQGGNIIGLSPWAGNIEVRDSSTVNIDGGRIQNYLTCEDMSRVSIKSGSAGTHLYARHHSYIEMSGGTVGTYHANNFSELSTTNGVIGKLYANDNCIINFRGGTIGEVAASTNANITFYGNNFQTSGNLSIINDKAVGIGFLSGEWADGKTFSVNISQNFSSATIFVIPEPCSLSAFALGGLMMRKGR